MSHGNYGLKRSPQCEKLELRSPIWCVRKPRLRGDLGRGYIGCFTRWFGGVSKWKTSDNIFVLSLISFSQNTTMCKKYRHHLHYVGSLTRNTNFMLFRLFRKTIYVMTWWMGTGQKNLCTKLYSCRLFWKIWVIM